MMALCLMNHMYSPRLLMWWLNGSITRMGDQMFVNGYLQMAALVHS